MPTFLCALGVLLAGSVLSLGLGRHKASQTCGALTGALGGTLALASVWAGPWNLGPAWPLPLSTQGWIHLAMDPLSGFFVLIIGAIAALGSVYGYAYLKPDHDSARSGSGIMS